MTHSFPTRRSSDLTGGQIPDYDALAPAIAQIAGDYGVISRDQVQRQPDNYAPGYPCLTQFNRMRQMRATRNVRRIDTCLRQALETAPGDPVLLSALSWLRFGDWQPLRGTAAGKKKFADARALAGRAYESEIGRASWRERVCQYV